jgi:hypothetical protein
MRILRNPHPVTMFAAWFLMVFLVLFPKGGVKIGILPLTWGYMFLALSSPPLLLVRLVAFPLRLPVRLWVVLAALAPMQLLVIYTVAFYGIVEPSFAVSTITNLFFLPLIFLLIYPPFLRYVDGERLSRYFRWCILIAALWGIFLFFWHPITGSYIEIPYLTVNAADYGQLETTKNIARGLFFKLISTYNNGNIYGVATLILLPLYDLFETARWRRIVVKLALLFTLSRTVWLGLVAAQLLPLAALFVRQLATFPRVYLGRATNRIFALLATIGLIFAALLFNSSSLAFLFDPQLGGRATELPAFFHSTLLPSHGLSGLVELVYISAAEEFGYVGFIAMILLLASPVLLLLIDSSALQSPTRRAALKGLILYSILALSDGGFNFLPIWGFYWFMYMVYLFGWPGADRAVARRKQSALLSGVLLADGPPAIEAAS